MWSTLCYGSTNTRRQEAASESSPISVRRQSERSRCSIASAPYQIQILTAGDGTIPAQIADWGSPLKRAVGADPETVTVSISKPTRYVLVLFKQLAKTR